MALGWPGSGWCSALSSMSLAAAIWVKRDAARGSRNEHSRECYAKEAISSWTWIHNRFDRYYFRACDRRLDNCESDRRRIRRTPGTDCRSFFAWMLVAAKWSTVERKVCCRLHSLLCVSNFLVCIRAGRLNPEFVRTRSTDNRIGAYDFPASWYQSINALFIISLAPVFAWLWLRWLREPSSPAKFVWGLVLVGIGFCNSWYLVHALRIPE